MMRHSRNRPCLRRLWHTVGHGGYFDQSLLLVEGLGAEPFASHMVKTKAAWMERVWCRRPRADDSDASANSIAGTHRSIRLPQVSSASSAFGPGRRVLLFAG